MQTEAILRVRTALDVAKSIDTLRISMDESSRSNDELARKVHRLNVVLAWATVVGAGAALAGSAVATLQLLQ